MNRFSKDIDTIDNILADSYRMFLNTLSSIFGAIILIAIVLPWFLIAVAVVLVLYATAAVFYRASAREIKVSGFRFGVRMMYVTDVLFSETWLVFTNVVL